jgi:hypothetical protein
MKPIKSIKLIKFKIFLSLQLTFPTVRVQRSVVSRPYSDKKKHSETVFRNVDGKRSGTIESPKRFHNQVHVSKLKDKL